MALDEEERDFPAIIVERSRGWAAATIGMLVATPIVLFLMGEAMVDQVVATLGLLITLVAIPFAGWLTYHHARRIPARVRATPDGLHVSTERGQKQIPRGAFRGGGAFATANGRRVVALKGGRRAGLRLEVASDSHARAVLSAVGVDRREGTTRFVVKRTSPTTKASGIFGAAAFVALNFVVLFLFVSPLAFLLLWVLAPLAWLAGWMRNRTRLTIGTDGIELKPLLGKRRFLPHTRIERVMEMPPPEGQVVSHGFTVIQSDKSEIIELDTRAERFRGGIWHVDPVRDAVQHAWSAARGGISTKAAIQQIANAEASTREWIAKLRALGAGERRADYRAPAIDERALFEVVSDANADAELRAAAAVALGANAEHAPRLRVVADDIADDRVRRVAIAATEAESDEELEAELEPLNRRRMPRT